MSALGNQLSGSRLAITKNETTVITWSKHKYLFGETSVFSDRCVNKRVSWVCEVKSAFLWVSV